MFALRSTLAHSPMPPLSTLTARATHAHPLLSAVLASVPYGLVLVRVRVQTSPVVVTRKHVESIPPAFPPDEVLDHPSTLVT
jgi:hypothetical protein